MKKLFIVIISVTVFGLCSCKKNEPVQTAVKFQSKNVADIKEFTGWD